MSKIFKIFFLFLIIVFTSISIFIIYEKNNTNSYKILSIGDGLAKKIDSNKKYYDDFVLDYLKHRNKNVSYYNYSQEDISISELTNDLIYMKDKKLKEYLHTSNMVILSIGEAEIIKQKSPQEIKEDLDNLIKEIKKYNYNICLLGHYYLNTYNDKLIKEMNKIYKDLAKDNDIIYLNLENIKAYLNTNNIYPTERGHKEISKLIIKAIDLKK